MSSTYLQLIQDHCAKWNQPTPSGIVGSAEATIRQYQALAVEILEDLEQYNWQQQRVRITWTAVIGENQGALADLFPGYRGMVEKSLWDMTLRRPIYGPCSEIRWQTLHGIQVGGSLYEYAIFTDDLLIFPEMGSEDSLSAMYTSKYMVNSASGGLIERPTSDSDTFVFPDNVFKSQLEWRWLKQKEQAWTAAKIRSDDITSRALAKDSSSPMLNLSEGEVSLIPGIWVPAGSWNV